MLSIDIRSNEKAFLKARVPTKNRRFIRKRFFTAGGMFLSKYNIPMGY